MPVTILAVGDPHFKPDNIPEVELFIEHMINLATEKKPDRIVILGDVLDTHERLHSIPLNKAVEFIEHMRMIAKTYVLVGNHDMCLGKNTPVIMWNGDIKMSQDIKVGDQLIGDDGKVRNVLSTCKGSCDSYIVQQKNGIDYVVNKNHILSLKCGFHKSLFYNNTKRRWTAKWIEAETMSLRSKFFIEKEKAQTFLNSVRDMDIIDIPLQKYLKVPKNVKERLYGYKSSAIQWPSQYVEIDPYILGMWLGDGCKQGRTFASADIELIQAWYDWALVNGGEIVHEGQYNYSIRNNMSKYQGRTTEDICSPNHTTKKCRACIYHISKYKRAPSLICASVNELESMINGDSEMVSYFSTGASKEQIEFLSDIDNIKALKNWKAAVQKKDVLYIPTHRKGILRYFLKKYNLQNNKHIPRCYIVNSEQTRLQLLAGFIDTDGCVVDGRSVQISQSGRNKEMIQQLDFLCKSLGFACYTKENKNYRRLHISGNIEKIPTRLLRKKCVSAKGIDKRGRKYADKSRTSLKIKNIGEQDYYGFAVDGNNRFLLGDFTVTHNCNNQQFLTQNHWLNCLKGWENVVIVDKVVSEVINGEKFVFCPYVCPGRFIEALNTLEEKWQDASGIFAHQEFAGCKMGAIVSVEGDKWPLEYPYVISGHIHSRQIIQDNVYYTGAAMQHAFGESSKNIIAYLTFDGAEYEREEIDLGLPRKKIVYMDVEDLDDYKPPKTEDKIKVTLSGSYDQFKALKKTKKYKNLLSTGVKVVFKPKKLKKKQNNKDGKITEIEDEKKEHSSDFNTILNNIVMEQKDPYLVQVFELVVNGKETDVDDVFFL